MRWLHAMLLESAPPRNYALHSTVPWAKLSVRPFRIFRANPVTSESRAEEGNTPKWPMGSMSSQQNKKGLLAGDYAFTDSTSPVGTHLPSSSILSNLQPLA